MSGGPGGPHTHNTQPDHTGAGGAGLRGLCTQEHAPSSGLPHGQRQAADQGGAEETMEEQQTGMNVI